MPNEAYYVLVSVLRYPASRLSGNAYFPACDTIPNCVGKKRMTNVSPSESIGTYIHTVVLPVLSFHERGFKCATQPISDFLIALNRCPQLQVISVKGKEVNVSQIVMPGPYNFVTPLVLSPRDLCVMKIINCRKLFWRSLEECVRTSLPPSLVQIEVSFIPDQLEELYTIYYAYTSPAQDRKVTQGHKHTTMFRIILHFLTLRSRSFRLHLFKRCSLYKNYSPGSAIWQVATACLHTPSQRMTAHSIRDRDICVGDMIRSDSWSAAGYWEDATIATLFSAPYPCVIHSKAGHHEQVMEVTPLSTDEGRGNEAHTVSKPKEWLTSDYRTYIFTTRKLAL